MLVVNLGGGDVPMAQQFLNLADIDTASRSIAAAEQLWISRSRLQ